MVKYMLGVFITLLVIYSGCSHDFKEVKLQLYGLILPGKITFDNNILIKYVWEGGGPLREIAKVVVDRSDNLITITPYGLLDLREHAYPCDIFTRTDTVSLGFLPTGTYIVRLVSETFAYYDTLIVPTDACDSLFQLYVTVINQHDGDAITGYPLALVLGSPADTILRDTTDESGHASFMHSHSNIDGLFYYLYVVDACVKLGVPEIITIGLTGSSPQ